jgi:hypothetical protein
MRQRRTIYFNDARHYYLFVHEPPMRMVDAWSAVDEVAGTGIDTFVYGISRDDGLFYPSRVGRRFGEDTADAFDMAAYWRVWHNMQSLLDRGLDPLQVLIDRAHERGLDFVASLRMGGYPGLPTELSVVNGGRGMALEEVRDFQFRLTEELLTSYSAEGIELDFAAAPGGTSPWFKPEEAQQQAPVMTEFVRRVAHCARQRPGKPGLVGARVYPTPELNERTGLEVERWLQEGLVDYVVPMVYADMVLDSAMPLEWIIEAAHTAEVSVYAMLQPYFVDGTAPGTTREYPTAAMFRAAAANYNHAGVDGLYTWFMSWPLGEQQRDVLSQLADPVQVAEGDKHYFIRSAPTETNGLQYPAALPVAIDPTTDLGKRFSIDLVVGDDLENRSEEESRVGTVELRLDINELTTADHFEIYLNGELLSGAAVRRQPTDTISPYSGQRLLIELQHQLPVKGKNRLEFALLERPGGLMSQLRIDAVELIVQYDTYTTTVL